MMRRKGECIGKRKKGTVLLAKGVTVVITARTQCMPTWP